MITERFAQGRDAAGRACPWLPFAVWLLFVALLAACGNGAAQDMADTDIIPGKSIGEVRVGAGADTLPARTKLEGEAGELDGIHFTLVDGRVDEVWIEDIRVFPRSLRFQERVIDPKASLSEIQQIFGGCEEVEGIKGGIFYNCKAGVSLGTSFDGSDGFIQLRARRR